MIASRNAPSARDDGSGAGPFRFPETTARKTERSGVTDDVNGGGPFRFPLHSRAAPAGCYRFGRA
jgi:hypothetical protein